jgi:hypothetical protein
MVRVNRKRVTAAAISVASAITVGRALLSRQQVWTMGRGGNGFFVQLTTVPMWATLTEAIVDSVPCIHPEQEWPWKIGVGRDEDGRVAHSLGHGLLQLCNARHSATHRFQKHRGSVPMTDETAQKITPDWYAECQRIFSDD